MDINKDSGKLLRTFEGHTDGVTTITFSPDGKEILSGSLDKTVRLWDKDSGKLLRTSEIHIPAWNYLCWYGSLNRQAKDVLFACDQTVKLAPDEISKVVSQGRRGLARALTGDTQGAIKDFKVFVQSPNISEEYKTKRKKWIEALRKGENPFTDEVLEELRSE